MLTAKQYEKQNYPCLFFSCGENNNKTSPLLSQQSDEASPTDDGLTSVGGTNKGRGKGKKKVIFLIFNTKLKD